MPNIASPMIMLYRTLTQSIQNMLDNTADASPDLVLFNAQWNDKMLTIEIKDFGKGLTVETKKHLGKPFFTSKNEQGMGLGVYLTQTTLARYDGQLSLNNHNEGGVLASLHLPLNKLRPINYAQ